VFVHYGLDPSGRGFQPVIRDATAVDLDRMFSRHGAALFFYGHDHRQSDVMGRARYVNPGALGCNSRPVARYCVAEFRRGQYRVEHRSVPYDDAELLSAFEQRKVPARKFIYHAFYGDRFRTDVETCWYQRIWSQYMKLTGL